MTKSDKNNRLSLRLDAETHKRLEDSAAAKGVSVSDALRDFINDAPNKIMEQLREVQRENAKLQRAVEDLKDDTKVRDEKFLEHFKTIYGCVQHLKPAAKG